MILLSSSVFAVNFNVSHERNIWSWLGDQMNGGGTIEYKNEISEDLKILQEQNAEGDIQVASKDQIFAIKKLALLDMADEGWDIIIATFKLIYEVIVLLMYLIEMRLILYVLIDLIPMVFIKLKDRIAIHYIERRRR